VTFQARLLLAHGRARQIAACHARCHPLKPQIPCRFALCPFSEAVAIWFPSLVVAFVVCHAIGLKTGSASQDYIQLYEGDAKLLTESLEHIQQTAAQILNAIGAEVFSAPPA
jgi:hypothetical protein